MRTEWSHTIDKELVKPAALKMVNIVVGRAATTQIPFSNGIINNRKMSWMMTSCLNSIGFNLKPGEVQSSTRRELQCVQSKQLVVFMRYVK